jgi:hypothetical protein
MTSIMSELGLPDDNGCGKTSPTNSSNFIANESDMIPQ